MTSEQEKEINRLINRINKTTLFDNETALKLFRAVDRLGDKYYTDGTLTEDVNSKLSDVRRMIDPKMQSLRATWLDEMTAKDKADRLEQRRNDQLKRRVYA